MSSLLCRKDDKAIAWAEYDVTMANAKKANLPPHSFNVAYVDFLEHQLIMRNMRLEALGGP